MTYVASPEIGIMDQPEVIKSPGDEYYGVRYEADSYKGERGDKFGVEQLETGCNFAVRTSSDARNVDLCFTDPRNPGENDLRWRLERSEATADGAAIYSGFIAGLMPGDLYRLRVERENPQSYETPLLDPYAKAITRLGLPDSPDSPAYCVVVNESDGPSLVEKPKIDPKQRVIYETHVRDATMLNTEIPEELRGTYEGFAHPVNIASLKRLGITTVELQPVHQFFSEESLVKRGMQNHWGYNTVGFFAPHEEYASNKTPGMGRQEFKKMVNQLHLAGIEVVLDVVYNHTADGPLTYESDDKQRVQSPTYSLRGLDDDGYYVDKFIDDNGFINYRDTTGCGNTIDTSKPAASQLVRDSLRYWANEMGVDGFRFDLAPSVGDKAFFESLKRDPELQGSLLIAEPWSWGKGYPAGSFAELGVPEWNGKFRDDVRDFWGGRGSLGALAYVMAGSFNPANVVNFLTAHDGFTLRDVVSYNGKHNQRNKQPTNNGEDNNRSYNHGVEGHTDDARINELRRKTGHNLINTLFMSHGIAMWLGGDEIGHTQDGNNNAYCREIVASDDIDIHSRRWSLAPDEQALTDVVAGAIALRQQGSMGDPDALAGELPDSPIHEHGIDWLNHLGNTMRLEDWNGRVMGLYTSGRAGTGTDASYITYVNGGVEDVNISLPTVLATAGDYVLVSDAETGQVNPAGIKIMPEVFTLKAMSSVVLKRISSRLPQHEASPTAVQELKFPRVQRNIVNVAFP